MSERRCLGLFDRGIGGLTVAARLRESRPDLDLIFYGDSGRLSMDRTEEQVVRSVRAACQRLSNAGAEAVILACNSADAAARDILAAESGMPVISVIESCAREAIAASATGRIGVIATGMTIRSGAYPAALRRWSGSVEVFPVRCSGVVEFIENGDLGNSELRCRVAEALDPLAGQVDTLILGCTHFPFIRDFIRECAGPKVRLVTGERQMRADLERIGGWDRPADGVGSLTIWTSGSPDRARQAARRLGLIETGLERIGSGENCAEDLTAGKNKITGLAG